MLFWFLAAPVAIIVRACTTEEICREPREYCEARQAFYREQLHAADHASLGRRAAYLVLQKLFYIPTCEYCFSFWVSLALVVIAGYRIHFDDWRGLALATFVVMGVANVYMSAFSQLRVDSRKDRAMAEQLEDNH
ncbi:MAG TPA: hypothetical protein VJ783_20545 [Pirellulales bacterium]|nr:hypothetical protein [Pirellulales bacterium]